jgi:hypothetical protein
MIPNVGAFFDDDLGADSTGFANDHPLSHNGRGVLKGFLRMRRRGIQQTRRFGKGQIGLIRHQGHCGFRKGVGQIRLNKTGPRLRCGQVLDVFSVAQKRHIRGTGMGNGGHIAEIQRQRDRLRNVNPRGGNNLRQRNAVFFREKTGINHDYLFSLGFFGGPFIKR